MPTKSLKQTLTDIASAIREKDGTSTTMTSQEMPDRIRAIPTGGGDEDCLPLLVIDQYDGGRDECGFFAISDISLSGIGSLTPILKGGYDTSNDKSFFIKKLNSTDKLTTGAKFNITWGSNGCGGQLNYHVIVYFYGKNAPMSINLNTDWSGATEPTLSQEVIAAINTAISNNNIIRFDILTNG